MIMGTESPPEKNITKWSTSYRGQKTNIQIIYTEVRRLKVESKNRQLMYLTIIIMPEMCVQSHRKT